MGQQVTIIGPNLPAKLAAKGTLHVHAAGCADIAKRYGRQHDGWDTEVDSKVDAVMDIYSPGEFDYDPLTEWEGYRSDVYFAPCVTVPEGTIRADGDGNWTVVR